MKIDSSVKSVGNTTAGIKRAPLNGGTAGAVAANVDTVQISSGLQEAGGLQASASLINADRVAEIKQAIAEGRFQVNPERIADGLINSVKQMLVASR